MFPRLIDEHDRALAQTGERENCAGCGHRWVVSGAAPRAAHHSRGGERPTRINDLDARGDAVIYTYQGDRRAARYAAQSAWA
jgi:hypothetical protein